jgi:hypothetical protein
MSNKSVGDNYADKLDDFVPVRPELLDGPFFRNTSLAAPSTILTQTHCTGYDDRTPLAKSLQTVDSFEYGCCSGKKRAFGNMSFVESHYSPDLVSSAIHLFRNP